MLTEIVTCSSCMLPRFGVFQSFYEFRDFFSMIKEHVHYES